jgi:hypothetical protein
VFNQFIAYRDEVVGVFVRFFVRRFMHVAVLLSVHVVGLANCTLRPP